jgi:uncharacterized protein YqeY
VINALKKCISSRVCAQIPSLDKVLRDVQATAAESYAPSSPSSSPEHYTALQNEISLIQSYLPASSSLESVQQSISDIIASLSEEGRSGKGAMAVVIKELWERLGDGGKGLDRKEVGKMVSEAMKKK